ncbi:MAG: transcription/translation regulatory transformer protein RfaH [Pseudomonadota bacterium]
MTQKSAALWYLLYCKPRQELRAQQHLANQGFHTFVPQLTLQKLRANRWCEVTEPLFPRYLFLHVPSGQELNMRAIRATRGITDFVRFGTQLATVPQQLVALLTEQQISQKQQVVLPVLNAGDAVDILTGPFAGLNAVFNTQDGEKRSVVLVSLLGQWLETSVDNSAIKAKSAENNN